MSIEVTLPQLVPEIVRGVKTAVQNAVAKSLPFIENWVKKNVPKDTGLLISSFFVRYNPQTLEFEFGFNAPHSIYAETMRERGATPKGGRIAPFVFPLTEYTLTIIKQFLRSELKERNIEMKLM